MINLFRRIRKRLLAENRLSRYLFYATGEIILVVVGIFIALQLNIWNEKRKTVDEIETILSEVQKDLATNIRQSEQLYAYYRRADSLITLMVTNRLGREDYLSPENIGLSSLAMNAYHMKIYNKGFLNLSEKLDDVPTEYAELVEPLNEIYTYNKYEIDKFDDRLDKITDRLMDEIAADKPWLHEMFSGDNPIPEDALDYYLNDPHYKNALLLYTWAAENLVFHVGLFNRNAIDSYRRIHELTGQPEVLPDFIPRNQLPLSDALTQEVTGTYEVVQWSKFGLKQKTMPITIQFQMGDDCLELVDLNRGTTRFYLKDIDQLYNTDVTVELNRDGNGVLTGLTTRDPIDDYLFRKVD